MQAKRGYFKIYDFMLERLGLTGTPLLIYALIYSFFEAGHRFRASRAYIAQRVGTSPRTVVNAIATLTERGLIEREGGEGETPTYTVVTEWLEMSTPAKIAPVKDLPVGVQDLQGSGEAFSPNKETYNKNITTTPTNTARARAAGRDERNMTGERRYTPRSPKYRIEPAGLSELVRMTPEQYYTLLSLVGDEALDTYLLRMQHLLEAQGPNNPIYVHSPYRTIRKWIEEDTSV